MFVEIGRGSFGVVYRKDNKCIKEFYNNEECIDEYNHHKKCISQFVPSVDIIGKTLYLPYCGNPIVNINLTVEQSNLCILQISKACLYCKEKNIVHNDIKPDNILYDGKQFYLTDFSIAYTPPKRKHLGSVVYKAPEILIGIKKYDHYKCDVWSLAFVICYNCDYLTEKYTTLEEYILFLETCMKNIPQAKPKICNYMLKQTNERYSFRKIIRKLEGSKYSI